MKIIFPIFSTSLFCLASGAAAPAYADCVLPESFGAITGDGLSDRAAIQSAIDTAEAGAGEVCFSAGVYDLTQGGSSFSSVRIRNGRLVLRGSGPRTVLRQTGMPPAGSTWRMILIDDGATDILITQLTLDGSGVATVPPPEQTHLIQIGSGTGTVDGVTVRDVYFADSRGGDCIRIAGYNESLVSNVLVEGTQFSNCDRSGISARGAFGLTIAHNTFVSTTDQDIDVENGAPNSADARFFIHDNLFIRDADAQGPICIAIGGTDADLKGLIISKNIMLGGGIVAVNVADVVISDNNIFMPIYPTTADPAISISRRGSNVRIHGNLIARPAGGSAGHLISMYHRACSAPSGWCTPENVEITDNILMQGTLGDTVHLESISRVKVSGNRIQYSGPSGNVSGIFMRAIVNAVDLARIDGNTIEAINSTINAGVFLAGTNGQSVLTVSVTNNIARNASFGLLCQHSIQKPVLSIGNYWEVATAGHQCPGWTAGPNAGTP